MNFVWNEDITRKIFIILESPIWPYGAKASLIHRQQKYFCMAKLAVMFVMPPESQNFWMCDLYIRDKCPKLTGYVTSATSKPLKDDDIQFWWPRRFYAEVRCYFQDDLLDLPVTSFMKTSETLHDMKVREMIFKNSNSNDF